MEKTGFFVNWFDLFGQQMNLQIFKQDKRNTIFGAIMGLISLALMSAVSIYFFVSFIQKNNKQIIQNQDLSTFPYNNLTNFPLVVAIQSGINLLPNDGTIFNVHAFKRNDNYSNGIYYGTTFVPLNLFNCSQAQFAKYKLDERSVMKQSMCLEPGDQNSLKSYPVDAVNGYSGILFLLSRCNPTTNSNCKSKAVIDATLEGAFFSFGTYFSTIDNNNITNPSSSNLFASTFTVSNTLYKRFIVYLTQNLYQDDTGILFESLNTYDFFTLGDTTTDYALTYPAPYLALTGGETPIAQMYITNTSYIQRTYRSYMKAQTVLANIGGIIKFILVVSTFITDFVTRKLLFSEIGDYVFDYDSSEKRMRPKGRTIVNNFMEEIKQEIQPPEVNCQGVIAKPGTRDVPQRSASVGRGLNDSSTALK